MIRALIVGTLQADPQGRTSKSGKPFATARLHVPMGDEGRVFCSVIAFDDEAVGRLLQMRAGASAAVAGTLKVGTYEGKGGTVRASLDLVADEVASTSPRPRKQKSAPTNRGHQGGDPFADLPGAGDIDWLGA